MVFQVISSEGEKVSIDYSDEDSVISDMSEVFPDQELQTSFSTNFLIQYKHFFLFQELVEDSELFASTLNDALKLMDKKFISFLKNLFFSLDGNKQGKVARLVNEDVLYEILYEGDIDHLNNIKLLYLWCEYNFHTSLDFQTRELKPSDKQQYYSNLVKKVTGLRDCFTFLLKEDNHNVLSKMFKINGYKDKLDWGKKEYHTNLYSFDNDNYNNYEILSDEKDNIIGIETSINVCDTLIIKYINETDLNVTIHIGFYDDRSTNILKVEGGEIKHDQPCLYNKIII